MEGFFNEGRMISASKSGYYEKHPNNLIVFNANIVTGAKKKIWHGDLDVTADAEAIAALAKTRGEDLHILREMDARFSTEAAPRIDRAVATFRADGNVVIHPRN